MNVSTLKVAPAEEKIKAAGASSKAGADGDSSREDGFIIQRRSGIHGHII
ncbi:hypothetical protein AFE_3160 [Acidithiobacillus ferrooxidans ATCC 23270]|uniref:Uncharacterized protein n=1 Tax=Acidithiobacillus ferrooxidans (strain ATCC 23270 / DSM 14882 / CIP 104768 / NCIMB 8455) TaxID=243159 RepID=B7JAR3_ACIF2|nr:hypothetical protein AFE_3160 [Acidithiobacillus ferrooxidans ATCC 23270]EGQ61177.1 hypothetical protein GGI1_04961 [Acidithiobacillus sp. GGI-221]